MPRTTAAIAVLILFPSLALAQQQTTADDKELAAYTLTMENVKKVTSVMQQLAALEPTDPLEIEEKRLRTEIDKLQQKDELTPAEEAQLDKLYEQRRALEDKQEALDAKADVGEPDAPNAQTLSEMEGQMKREPRFAAMLAREGLTPRDAAKTIVALLQASMIVGFSQGKVDFAKLPPGVNAANVRFVQQHQAELEKLNTAAKKP